jgi:drug/metabolite transporter (DMT)-like permease
MTKIERLGLFQGLLSVFLISLSSIAAKILLKDIPSESLIIIREILSVLVIFMIFGLSVEFKKIAKFKKHTLIILVISSILSGAITPFLFLKGLAITPASDTALISSMSGIVAGIMSSIFLKDKISLEKILGACFMFLGVTIIATHNFQNGLGVSFGYYLLFGSILSGAVATILFKKFLTHLSTDIIVLSRNILGIILLLGIFPFLIPIDYDFQSIKFNQKTILIFVSYAIFTLMIADFLWYKALGKIKISSSSILIFLKPLLGVILAYFILSEKIAGFHFLGGSLIIAGLIMSMFHHKKYSKSEIREKIHQLFHHFHF